jgi:hypothetical protein
MKWTKRVLFLALGISATLMASAAAWLVLRPVPPVTVTVANRSGKAIASVRLEHERGAEVLENLGSGDAKAMRFEAGGETTYRLRIRFADGSELVGGGGYAEAGYEFSETIRDSAIKTDLHLPPRY